MTKKDYVMLANLIASNSYYDDGGAYQGGDAINKEVFVPELAEALKADNPNFNSEMFIDACNK